MKITTSLALPLLLSGTLLSASTTAQSCDCEGELGERWSQVKNRAVRAGGCVGPNATVSENVFIAPSAKVCGNAMVTGQSRIFGSCVVSGNSVVEKTSCYGNARIDGNAKVLGKYTRVFENAHVSGDTQLTGMAIVRGYQRLKEGSYDSGTFDGQLAQNTQ